MKILVFDPGESTGWVFYQSNPQIYYGGTAPKDHRQVANLIYRFVPDLVIYESFRMFPGKAQALSWNTFYPCEVIGVIRYLCLLMDIKMKIQEPSVKKYAGGFDTNWEIVKESSETVTEHTKDAYLHLRYHLRNAK